MAIGMDAHGVEMGQHSGSEEAIEQSSGTSEVAARPR